MAVPGGRAVTFLSGIDTDISDVLVNIHPSMLMYTTLVKLCHTHKKNVSREGDFVGEKSLGSKRKLKQDNRG